ncbi:unnamed protein product, partial [Pneumocystis jirovecii]
LTSPPLSLDSDILRATDDDVSSVKSDGLDLVSSMSSQSDSDASDSFTSSPNVAYIVAFRNRFSQLFQGIPDLGPQDIERSKHFSRALNESIDTHIKHLDPSWCGYSPLHRDKGFYSLDASDKLKLLCCLVDWCLMSSEAVRSFIDENYKDRASNDKRNALLVHPLGKDAKNRKLWLIEGNDTPFRVYRESKSRSGSIKWKSIAGTVDELRQYALSLSNNSSLNVIALVPKILNQICPRIEKAQIRRDKLDANRARLAALNIEPALLGMRTRGKRIKYTFSDDENDDDSNDDLHISILKRRTPLYLDKSVQYTARGRMIKRPRRGDYGIYEETNLLQNNNYREFGNTNELSKNLLQNDNHLNHKNDCYASLQTESESFSLKVLLKYNPKKLMPRLT